MRGGRSAHDDGVMKENDETQPSPAEEAGHNQGEPVAQGSSTPGDRPVAEGPATDGGAQAGPAGAQGPPPGGTEPPPPGGYGPPSYGGPHPGAYGRPPRLTRRAQGQDRVIGGVAGGIADYFGVDPLVVRLAFVGFTLLGGGGVILYVLGWIFIPERREGEAVKRASRTGRSEAAKYLGLGLIAVATLILADGIGFGPRGLGIFEHVFFATILVGLGVYLLRRESEPAGPAYPPAPTAPPPQTNPPQGPPPESRIASDYATTERLDAAQQTQPVPSPAHPAATIGYEAPKGQKPRRERSQLALFTLAAMLLTTGAAALLNNVGITSFDGGQLSALALIVLGGGLIVGAWWGRARSLVWVGLLMLPVVAFLSLIDLSMVPFEGEVGRISERPREQIEIASGYEVLAGEAFIDLGDFQFSPDEKAELTINMAVGETTVRVPRDVYVEADLSLQGGQIVFFESERGGQGVSIVASDGDPDSDARLILVIDGALGQIDVQRSPDEAVVEGQVSDTQEKSKRKPQRRERERP